MEITLGQSQWQNTTISHLTMLWLNGRLLCAVHYNIIVPIWVKLFRVLPHVRIMLKEVDGNDDVAAFGEGNTIDSGVFHTCMRHSGMNEKLSKRRFSYHYDYYFGWSFKRLTTGERVFCTCVSALLFVSTFSWVYIQL